MKNYVDAMTPNVPRYLQVNKSLLRNAKALGLGLDEVILYAKICNRAQLSCANGRVDDYGRIYVTYSRMEYVEETGCSKGFAIKAFRALIQAGLTVEVEQVNRAGCTAAHHIYPKRWSEPSGDCTLDDIRAGGLEYVTPRNVGAMDGAYLEIPVDVLDNRDVSLRAKVLYAIAWDLTRLSVAFARMDTMGRYWCEISQDEAMELLGCGRDALSRAYSELLGAGLITRVRAEYGCPMRTYLHPSWISSEDGSENGGDDTSNLIDAPQSTEVFDGSCPKYAPQTIDSCTQKKTTDRDALSYIHGKSIRADARDAAETEKMYCDQVSASRVRADVGLLVSGENLVEALDILDLALSVMVRDTIGAARKVCIAGTYIDKRDLLDAYGRIDRYIMDTLILRTLDVWGAVGAPEAYLRAALWRAYDQHADAAYYTRQALESGGDDVVA